MASFQVTTRVEGYTGISCGVAFQNGQATVDDSEPEMRAALAYFRRHGYGVTGGDAAAGSAPASVEPALSANKPEWVTWAVAQGATQADAEAATKTDLIEKYGTKGGEA